MLLLNALEWILGGISCSKSVYDPKATLKRLKKEFSLYPEQLRKRRILQLDDDAAMYAFSAEREIKRKDYCGAAYYLRNANRQLAHSLFPLNGQYFISKKNLIDRINNLDKVPKRFSKIFRPVLFDLKPDEASMNLALKSIIGMLQNLRRNFHYLRFREEFPV